METAIFSFSIPRFNLFPINFQIFNRCGLLRSSEVIVTRNLHFQVYRHRKSAIRFTSFSAKVLNSNSQSDGTGDTQNSVQELRVPSHWLEPSKASEESEWLRLTLNKWLDDEYCPEDTNTEISKVAADSFYESLMVKRVELGEILLKMALDLETISYQESFHGAFSSANAAVNLVVQRISSE